MCLRERCMRENCTCSLSGGRRLARKRASSDPTAMTRPTSVLTAGVSLILGWLSGNLGKLEMSPPSCTYRLSNGPISDVGSSGVNGRALRLRFHCNRNRALLSFVPLSPLGLCARGPTTATCVVAITTAVLTEIRSNKDDDSQCCCVLRGARRLRNGGHGNQT